MAQSESIPWGKPERVPWGIRGHCLCILTFKPSTTEYTDHTEESKATFSHTINYFRVFSVFRGFCL